MARNIVLIILDCVRKDFFDRYAPKLQKLSDVSFEQARAASSWSPPSHGAIFSGELPSEGDLHINERDFSVLSERDSLFTDLPEHTYLGVNANPAIGGGLETLFDQYAEPIVLLWGNRFYEGIDLGEFIGDADREDIDYRTYMSFLKACLTHERPFKSLYNGFSAFLSEYSRGKPFPKPFDDGARPVIRACKKQIQSSQEPFFMFINFLDAHHYYQHHTGLDRDLHDVEHSWTSQLDVDHSILFDRSTEGREEYVDNRRQLYGASVDYLDRKVYEFVEYLQDNTEEETTVIITADHGENLGFEADENIVHHKSSLSEALLHVPLVIVNPPDEAFGREEINDYVSHLQIRELVRGLAEADVPDITRERVAAERIGTWDYDAFVERTKKSGFDPDTLDWLWVDRAIRCVYDGERKWEWDSLDEQIEWEIDFERPCWQQKVDSGVEIPEWASEFFTEDINEYKEQYVDENAVDETTDDSVVNRLKTLGYM
ncbi:MULTISPECIES: sulfatase-like hydrolase/transferase [Salinibaculum]|uniref:sulfatase-like hydrolase/transferase n=1 Tax=Salinibaculum TaxID=2732368 RepID=UPI0030D1E79C